MANNRIARVAVSVTPGRGRHVELVQGNTSVNTGPPVIMGVTALQLLGGFSGTVQVDCPKADAGAVQDLTFVSALSPGLPNNFILTPGSSGIVQATVALVLLPDDPNIVVSCPALSLTFGTGLPTATGSGTWSLRDGIAYQGPTVNAAVRCYSAAATADDSLTFLVQASLVGIPVAQ